MTAEDLSYDDTYSALVDLLSFFAFDGPSLNQPTLGRLVLAGGCRECYMWGGGDQSGYSWKVVILLCSINARVSMKAV